MLCIREYLPGPWSYRGFKLHEYVMRLVVLLCGGVRALEDIREFGTYEGLRHLCRYDLLPGADAIGVCLSKPGNLKGLKQVNQYLVRGVFARIIPSVFTLDVDATFIETE